MVYIIEGEFDIFVVFDERVDGPAYPVGCQIPGEFTVYPITADNGEGPLLLSFY